MNRTEKQDINVFRYPFLLNTAELVFRIISIFLLAVLTIFFV
ncbi:hypothetical protein D083_2456 [Dickeya solani RNS 08.23.3.1.A]|nr:hypothetical protein D083_2456 [Dickeya solani RNS 08.23.3.1.A]